jgi:hypothetical protein
VLTFAAVLHAVEFVADRIPYVDSAWDVLSTAIRPTVGAVVGVLLAAGLVMLLLVARLARPGLAPVATGGIGG